MGRRHRIVPRRNVMGHKLGAAVRRLQDSARQLRTGYERLWKRFPTMPPALNLIAGALRNMGAHDASHMAAGVAYYAILSIFPLTIGLVALLGYFLPSEDVQQAVVDFFGENFPTYVDVVERNIDNVIELRGTLSVISLIGLFWTASAMFGAVGRSINRAMDIQHDRPFWLRKLRDFAMALGTGLLILLSLGATSLIGILRATDVAAARVIVDVGARLFALLLSLLVFLLLYKFMPNTKTYWKHVWPGALLAAVLFEIAQSLFLVYVTYFANFQEVYGWVTSAVTSLAVLLVSVYISALIVILGAEFNSAYSRMKATPS